MGGRGGNGGSSLTGAGGVAAAAGLARGGGIFGGSVTIVNSNFTGNRAVGGVGGRGGSPAQGAIAQGHGGNAFGGALVIEQAGIIAGSALVNNYAVGGSGGPAGASAGANDGIQGSYGGLAAGGAIVVANEASLQISNSTVSSNEAQGGHGGEGGYADPTFPTVGGVGGTGGPAVGGGIDVALVSTSVSLHNSTIAFNRALTSRGGFGGTAATEGARGQDVGGEAGGIRSGSVNDSSSLTAISTIIAENIAEYSPDVVGHFASAKYVLLQESGATGISDGVHGNTVGQDPKLGPLADNGGSTWTHALLPGSPALDRGWNPLQLTTDQRDMPRSSGGRVDIGALESQAPRVILGAPLSRKLPG